MAGGWRFPGCLVLSGGDGKGAMEDGEGGPGRETVSGCVCVRTVGALGGGKPCLELVCVLAVVRRSGGPV